MEVLEIEPPQGKSIIIYLVEKEYEEQWKFGYLQKFPLNILSKKYCEFVKGLVTKFNPDFVVEELGLRSEEEFDKNSQLAKYLDIPVYPVDLPENAKGYIEATLIPKMDTLNQIKIRLKVSTELDPKQIDTNWEQNLLAWGEYLEEEIRSEEENVRTSVREAWMIKHILDYAKRYEKSEVACLFICSYYHFEGLTSLCSQYDIKVRSIRIKKEFVPKPNLTELLKPLKMEIRSVRE